MSTYNLVSPEGRVYPIEGETVFGRSPVCTYAVNDLEISRRHAALTPTPDGLTIRDEGSANGTFVNGHRLKGPVTLSDGDEIRFGKTVLTLRITDWRAAATVPPGATPPPPAPPAQPAPPEAAPADAPSAKRRSFLPWALVGCGGLLACAVCSVVVWRLGFFSSSTPTQEYAQAYTLEAALADETTDDRPGVLAYLGRPEAFTISQVIVDGTPVRLESWRYYGFGTRVDFVDGEAAWTMDIDPLPDGTLMPAWYDPLDFKLGMAVEDASAVAQAASPASMKPEVMDISEGGDDLEGAFILAGDQIMIGLDPSGLVYVETMVLAPQEGE